jgi:hypothetical protein
MVAPLGRVGKEGLSAWFKLEVECKDINLCYKVPVTPGHGFKTKDVKGN